jgi:tRNA nucleotidyltransferase/poly(A) polymerase
MTTVAHIDPSRVAQALDQPTQTVVNLLKRYHIPHRIVGGAVRDLLLGKEPRDIDLVVDADPSTLIYIFGAHDIPQDLSGIVHGTVKAVFGSGKAEQKVDVSSLGYRIHRHGNRLETDRTHNWATDSKLRDLTINSMSMDMDGTVYDYTGGYDDLQNSRIRIGQKARSAMVLDPTGIMRYFKGVSMFPDVQVRQKDLDFIQQNVPLLADVADDKKTAMNMVSILKSPNREKTLKLMCKMKVQEYLPYAPCLA